jgi:ribulose-bisphosphate carboxylase large chain
MREAWASAERGETLDDAYASSEALRRAAETFGKARA